eukprot:gene18296-23979_t
MASNNNNDECSIEEVISSNVLNDQILEFNDNFKIKSSLGLGFVIDAVLDIITKDQAKLPHSDYSDVEGEEDDDIVKISLSNISDNELKIKTKAFDITIKESFLPDPSFIPFAWNGRDEDNDQAMTEAMTHLNNELVKFRAPLREGFFKFVDVHTKKNFLDYDHPRFQLSGGTDFVVVPYLTPASIGTVDELCIVFEIKTDEVMNKGIEKHYNEAIAELIASRCLSSQPVILLILTDLAHKTTMFQYSFDDEKSSFYIDQFENVSLEQMAVKVRHHLEVFCVPNALYESPDDVEKANDIEKGVVHFKKRQRVNTVKSLALEQL